MNDRWLLAGVFLAAFALAACGANDYAGGWNDGSRLATVEALVDLGTWEIDDSVFVRPPAPDSAPHPYGPHAAQFRTGTLDKLYIEGRYYSDKSPVPAVLLAGGYQVYRWCGGHPAAERPDLFCFVMTLLNSALPYAIAVACMWVLVRRTFLGPGPQALLVVSFAVGSLAWPYSRVVNNHVLLLGVTAALLVALQSGRLVVAGFLAGLAYAIDLGAGPVICAGAGAWVGFRSGWWSAKSRPTFRDVGDVAAFGLAALPFVALHHTLNFAIGGSWQPANANPAYFLWPGCPFHAGNMTGGWSHDSPLNFVLYAADLLVGKKGLLGHNPPLILLAFAPLALWQLRAPLTRLCLAWTVGVWMIYAVTSRNYSGDCISVRWFVPLVVPGYYLLIHLLVRRPDALPYVVITVAAGIVINAFAFMAGPWSGKVVWGYWLWLGLAGVACTAAYHRHKRRVGVVSADASARRAA